MSWSSKRSFSAPKPSAGGVGTMAPRERCVRPACAPPAGARRNVRIAAASDLHGTYRDVRIPAADVLVIAGDITRDGTLAEVADFGDWLAAQPHAAKIVISGNHDYAMQTDEAQTRRLLRTAWYLRDEGVDVGGRYFYGSPWILPYSGAFNATPADIAAKWSVIPDHTDVLVTHMPPHRVRDIGGDGRNHGDPALRARVARLRPRAHVFGHIHESHGALRAGRTTFANVAICDRHARPVRPVTIIDI